MTPLPGNLAGGRERTYRIFLERGRPASASAHGGGVPVPLT